MRETVRERSESRSPRPTLADVAAKAGVSRATASRALAGDARISAPTRAEVRRAADELGYVPNLAARSLRARHTRALGLLLPELSDPVHGQVAAGFELEAAAAGYTVIIVAARNDVGEERRALRAFIERSTDGICVASSAIDPAEARHRVGRIPLSLIQPDHLGLLRGPGELLPGTIQTDDDSGVRQAIGHLVDSGRRDLAYLGSGDRATNEKRRTTAEKIVDELVGRRLRTYQLGADAWLWPDDIAAVLGPEPPEAVLCYDDKTALALLSGLRRRGIVVPDDVAVVGFDGIPFAALANPSLSTVATPTAQMGKLGARALLTAITAGLAPSPAVLPVRLVVRESSGGPPALGRPLPHALAVLEAIGSDG
jgi:DNA-binding LacI/PurR family transcriptional regulator